MGSRSISSLSVSGSPRTRITPVAISAAGTSRRPHPTIRPMAVSRPRPTGPATSAYTPIPATIPSVMHRSPNRSPACPPRAEARPPTSRSTNVGGGGAAFRPLDGARLVPPLRGRWVVATVPTTVPVAPPATGVSRDRPDRNCGGSGRFPPLPTTRCRVEPPPVEAGATPSSTCGGCGRFPLLLTTSCGVGPAQRRGWQVGQWVVPLASMTLRRSSVPQRSHGSPARP